MRRDGEVREGDGEGWGGMGSLSLWTWSQPRTPVSLRVAATISPTLSHTEKKEKLGKVWMNQTRCRKEESGRAPESRANMLTEDNSREHETEEMSFSPSFLCEDLSSVSKDGEGFHNVRSVRRSSFC
ncbi:hypothetical protein JOQ06_014111 [Pogonophryne albipinna]|uniref:Uncharacterized protein n=1 Tax=Pogonophryne albipinna TaxID=1090488 RepID=A0AAD6AF86_9TELE|nr:hypothetical protein JOQ06_014111 [Pogonophryne albipinna]